MGISETRYCMLQAILMARMGDRYLVVAHNPIVKKAISKEKLTKRGLVSCTILIESPCTDRYARWRERLANQIMVSLLPAFWT